MTQRQVMSSAVTDSTVTQWAIDRGLDPRNVLELWNERAAIREYEGGMPRGEAEREALDDVRRSL